MTQSLFPVNPQEDSTVWSIPHGFSDASSEAGFSPQAFFHQVLQSGSLAHAYIFKGNDLDAMYGAALALAKILNCPQKPSSTMACGQCQQCRWIQANAHPAVMTLSRLTYLDPETLDKIRKTQKRPTQILTAQIIQLLRALSLCSEYFRVVVVTDVEEQSWSDEENAHRPAVSLPREWLFQEEVSKDDPILCLRPLNQRVFGTSAANKMLKTLEEPLAKTLFVFLTDSEESLLETIVSRCQVVKFPPKPQAQENLALFVGTPADQSFFHQLCQHLGPSTDFLSLEASFQEKIQEKQLTLVQGFQLFQGYLRTTLREGQSADQFSRCHRQLKILEQGRHMLVASVHPEQVLNQVFYQLCH